MATNTKSGPTKGAEFGGNTTMNPHRRSAPSMEATRRCSTPHAGDEEPRAAAEPSSAAAAPAAPAATAAAPAPAAATGYNVRDYQDPDAGAAERPLAKATKGNTKRKGKTKGKKGGGDDAVCFTCGSSGAKLSSCSQCHRAFYCNRQVPPGRQAGEMAQDI